MNTAKVLRKIREQKRQELMIQIEKEKEEKTKETIIEKQEKLFTILCTKDSYQYLTRLKENDYDHYLQLIPLLIPNGSVDYFLERMSSARLKYGSLDMSVIKLFEKQLKNRK